MAHLTGPDQAQTLLLPESLDEYVGPENPVRFIDAFVDGLDLAAAGFIRVEPKMTGRPGTLGIVLGMATKRIQLTPYFQHTGLTSAVFRRFALSPPPAFVVFEHEFCLLTLTRPA